MSMNLSIHSAGPSSHVAAFSEEGPGCGTHPPGWHPTWPPQAAMSLHSSRLDQVAINPQPLPPREGAGSLSGSASATFDDGEQCGNVPRGLPHNPPPVPWLDALKSISSIPLNPGVVQQLGL